MIRAYRPSRGSGLRDLLHIYLTTWREGAVMIAVPVLLWMAALLLEIAR